MHVLKNHDRIAGLVILAVSAFLFDRAGEFPAESRIFPRMILLFAMVLAGWMMLRSFVVASWRDKVTEPFFLHFGRFAITVSSMGLYVVAVEHIGYYTATILYLPLSAWVLGYRHRIVLALTTVGYIAFAFLVFDLVFELQFPEELFLRR